MLNSSGAAISHGWELVNYHGYPYIYIYHISYNIINIIYNIIYIYYILLNYIILYYIIVGSHQFLQKFQELGDPRWPGHPANMAPANQLCPIPIKAIQSAGWDLYLIWYVHLLSFAIICYHLLIYSIYILLLLLLLFILLFIYILIIYDSYRIVIG